ncbi:MAG: rhomboid family intramembrane serine protease [Crocinitomicaceae bacterium]
MLTQMFRNIPDVTKNLVILNVIFFLAKLVLESQGIPLGAYLGIYYPGSDLFEPYQIITSMFMHGDFFHLLFNMFALVVFGSRLEQVWGKKRFFIFYFATGIGAALFNWVAQGVEIYQLTGELFPAASYSDLQLYGGGVSWKGTESANEILRIYFNGGVGASGAVYGVLAGFALLFPNTELQLLFPPIPIKAKWLMLFLIGGALLMAYQRNPYDNVGHFVHLGGALVGFIMIQIWKRGRNNFY